MKIDAEIGILDSFWLGCGKNRPIRIVLNNPRDKGKIFSHVKNLAELTNANGFFLPDQ